jgi:hypothetical protein
MKVGLKKKEGRMVEYIFFRRRYPAQSLPNTTQDSNSPLSPQQQFSLRRGLWTGLHQAQQNITLKMRRLRAR